MLCNYLHEPWKLTRIFLFKSALVSSSKDQQNTPYLSGL